MDKFTFEPVPTIHGTGASVDAKTTKLANRGFGANTVTVERFPEAVNVTFRDTDGHHGAFVLSLANAQTLIAAMADAVYGPAGEAQA